MSKFLICVSLSAVQQVPEDLSLSSERQQGPEEPWALPRPWLPV